MSSLYSSAAGKSWLRMALRVSASICWKSEESSIGSSMGVGGYMNVVEEVVLGEYMPNITDRCGGG